MIVTKNFFKKNWVYIVLILVILIQNIIIDNNDKYTEELGDECVELYYDYLDIQKSLKDLLKIIDDYIERKESPAWHYEIQDNEFERPQEKQIM